MLRLDDAKNAKLEAECGIGSKRSSRIEGGNLIDILEHPHPDPYSGQRIFVVHRDGYTSSVSIE